MDKETFHNEAAFQMTMHILRQMAAQKLVSWEEYRAAAQMLIRKYQPFTGDLFT